MSYTQLALLGIAVAVVADIWVFRTRLLGRRVFWTAYAIIVFFQLATNGVLTGFRIVRYDGGQIIGSTTPTDGPPPFIGDGRLVFAPVEDLMFGFALVLGTLVLWIWWGRRGVQRTPYSGPPVAWFPGADRDSGTVRAATGASGAPADQAAAPSRWATGSANGADVPAAEPPPGGPSLPPRG